MLSSRETNPARQPFGGEGCKASRALDLPYRHLNTGSAVKCWNSQAGRTRGCETLPAPRRRRLGPIKGAPWSAGDTI